MTEPTDDPALTAPLPPELVATSEPREVAARHLVSEDVASIVPYKPGKPLSELERELGVLDAVKLASNENPLGPSPRAIEAAAAALRDAHRYPDGAAYELRNRIARHEGVDPAEVVVGNGSNELIELLIRTFTVRGRDHVVHFEPSFVIYELVPRAHGVAATAVPLRDKIHHDVGSLLAAVRPETKLVFIANPNNPTGTYVARADLVRLLSSLPRDVIPVLDEAYVAFADAADYAHALELRDLHPCLVSLRTFSKSYGLAGMRVGYAIMPAELAAYVHRVRAPFNVGLVAQAAAVAALDDSEHLRRTVELVRTGRTHVTAALRDLGLFVAPSQANFVLVDVARSGQDVYEQMLRLGVIVRPMPPPIASWLRITIGTEAENQRMIDALRRALGST
ncbi:MAG: histidinol-phosphate transaminase [Deltaproteobacteria bacterium]|nr:histidinol-phosphate transaminase [Deltaproteobacteria bacterium]